MARREIVGTRSSPRLTRRKKQSNHNIEKIETSYVEREEESSNSAFISENKTQSLSSSVEGEVPLPSATNTSAASLRTTTSRRGGKGGPGSTLTVRAASALKRSQREQNSSELREGGGIKSIQETMSESSQVVVVNTQPSTAAAAAAAAAQALCENPGEGRFTADLFRGYHEERQNVFLARRDVSVFKITTRSKNGIHKPRMPIGSSTVRVMGSATPTHISRHCQAYPDNHKMELEACEYTSPARSNKISVFRKPPYAEPGNELENSPQQILVSLKSGGSRSFDLMKSPSVSSPSRNRCEHKDDDRFLPQSLLSPEAPPQIQHSHLAGVKSETFFFDPRVPKTPKTPKSPNVDYERTEALQGTPSFSLFNQSFDSFGDSGYLRSPVGGGALIDQALPGTFSLEESSPQKRSLMASPRLHGFAFSPHERKSDHLDPFASESPGISLDKCIVEAMENAPFMPRANRPSSDPLMSSNVMVLEPNQTLRRVPSPTDSNRSPPDNKPSPVLMKRRLSPVPLEHRSAGPFHHATHHHPHGPPLPDHRMMRGPPPVPRRASVQTTKKPPLASKNASRESHSGLAPVASRHIFRRPQPPPHMYRSGRNADIYRPAKRSTTLSGLNVDDIHERLMCHKDAFNRCSFLLPGFRKALQGSVDRSTLMSGKVESPISATVSFDIGGISSNEGIPKSELDKVKERENLVIAGRRISSAICAFGGQLQKKNADVPTKSHYTESVINRFFEHESRISWDVEESPPIESSDTRYHSTSENSSMKRMSECFDMNPNAPKKLKPGEILPLTDDSRASPADDAPKMRYRCKLCGKPKQNHKCPYERSLQRSIGVTVHSAINSFSAAEPGLLAPPLTEMNNFLRDDALPEITPARPKRVSPPDVQIHKPKPTVQRSAPHVTPEQMRPSKSPPRYGYPYASPAHMMLSPVRNIRRINILSPEKNGARIPPSHRTDNVFIKSVPLRTEQFCSVLTRTLSHFEYPTIPLPYMQRKSLSDNLFELSKELPVLKEECAIMLRQAREEDMWDVAVAELLTQVIVAIHCPAEDKRLEGLSRYLNSMGFAC